MSLGEWAIVALILLVFVIPFVRRRVLPPMSPEPLFLRVLEYGSLIIVAIALVLFLGRVLWLASTLIFVAVILALIWFLALRQRSSR